MVEKIWTSAQLPKIESCKEVYLLCEEKRIFGVSMTSSNMKET